MKSTVGLTSPLDQWPSTKKALGLPTIQEFNNTSHPPTLFETITSTYIIRKNKGTHILSGTSNHYSASYIQKLSPTTHLPLLIFIHLTLILTWPIERTHLTGHTFLAALKSVKRGLSYTPRKQIFPKPPCSIASQLSPWRTLRRLKEHYSINTQSLEEINRLIDGCVRSQQRFNTIRE